jgi:hypothetical protein
LPSQATVSRNHLTLISSTLEEVRNASNAAN